MVIVGPAWRLNGVLSKAQNRLPQPGKECYYLPPSAASDSRHNLGPDTTVRRGAPGRVCQRVLTRRKIASRNLAMSVTTFRLLLPPTPGTTYAPAQPLAAERRGGAACGRRAALAGGVTAFRLLQLPTPGTPYAQHNP